MPLDLSPLYPILDASYLPRSILGDSLTRSLQAGKLGVEDPDNPLPCDEDRRALLTSMVGSLAQAGVTMLQYRNKQDDDLQVLRDATWLRRQAPRSLRIILNDRAHLVRKSGCDGVHLGQTDVNPSFARTLLGPQAIIGLSTHTTSQVRDGELSTADYLAIGPIYATGSKADAEAVIGLEGLSQARALTQKPLVAIGGITLARAAEVRAAGADSLAVISALFAEQGGSGTPSMEKLAKDFLELFR